jgi:hypothetical protein
MILVFIIVVLALLAGRQIQVRAHFVHNFFFLRGWVASEFPHPMFWLWCSLVFLFGLFCSCCWDGEREVEAKKVCWDGWDGMGKYVGQQVILWL